MEERHCPNCGAPITTEICPYCKAMTGLDTKNADMEYPVIECKEAIVSFWTFVFPLIFALAFGIPGIIIPIIFLLMGGVNPVPVILFCSLFVLGGLIALVIALIPVIRYFKVKSNGKEIDATVYGYMDDNLFINNQPAQIVKLLVQTEEGPRFILYKLLDTKKPYKINNKIKIRVYNDLFYIPKNNYNFK